MRAALVLLEPFRWYLAALRKYAVFGGRARRKEYWYFFLINVLVAICLAVATGMPDPEDFGVIDAYSLAVLVPHISVTVRRLHDMGSSGWWALLGLVPILNLILLLYFLTADSDENENRFGPNPKMAVQPPNYAFERSEST